MQLEHKLAGAMRTPFAVLLTQPRYSRARHYHLILPLVPDYGAVTGPEVLRLSGMEWMTVFARPPRAVLLPIPLVHSIWYSLAVVRETAYVVDDQSLAEIDQRLCGYFSLPPAGDEEKPR